MIDPAAASPSVATMPAAAPAARPRSAVSHGVGLAGMVGLIGWFLVAHHYGMDGPDAAIASTVACGIPMVLWSLFVDKVHRNPSTGIDWAKRDAPADIRTISLVKLTGLWATWGLIALIYGVMRFYWSGQYQFSMLVFSRIAIPLFLLSIPYVFWLDRKLVEPRDGAYAFGRWLLGQSPEGGEDYRAIWAHLRAWAVKGFFLAFMISIVPGNFIDLVHTRLDGIWADPVRLAYFAINILFLIDVHFATVGYVLTMRPLDAHIRTANPYGMAWVAALACYPPFVLMNTGGPLDYHVGSQDWNVWFAAHPTLLYIWGAMLAALTAVYAWATVAFGLRFSNLTHRGIITHGPYAWTRHPAYVSKNAFWWLSGLVILPASGSFSDALRNTAIMAMVSGVYYWRAKTEEKHLLADPAYRAYWEWAQAHALIPRLMSRFNGQPRPIIVLEPDPRVGPVA